MNLIISIIVILFSGYLIVYVAKKTHTPTVVALILLGLFIGAGPLKETIIKPNDGFISMMGDVGLISLMLIAGLETSWQTFYKERRDAVFIAISAAIIPFLLGFIIFSALGFSLITSLIIGICMSITAEATKAKVLLDLKKMKTRVGAAMMGAGIIDDLLGLSAFTFVTFLLHQNNFSEDLLVLMAISSFFVGVAIHKKMGRKHAKIVSFEKLLSLLIIPFFFVSMGMNFEFSSITVNPLLPLLLIGIAIIGKLGGSIIVKPFVNFSLQQLYLIGWGMNSRGAIEIALVMIAFRSNLITSELYSALIIMAIVTTILFPFIITSMVKKHPKIMD